LNNRLLIPLFLLLASLVSCKKDISFSGFNGFTQGTTYSIVYQKNGRREPDELKARVEKTLHEFDMSLSLYQDSSLISRINRNETDMPDPYFSDLFRKSVEVSEMTDGAFDVTVGPLVKAWGFGPDSHKDFTERKRDSLLSLVGFRKVEMRDGHLRKSDPRISLDFNAIAQGYSVDVICRLFDKSGLKNYLVEIGGEVRVKGTKGERMWKIGIDRPADNNMIPGNDLQAVVSLKDKSLATSGNYRKFYIEDGIKYSHTIDPVTGYPAKSRLLSATIVTDECAFADGIATACMVMGLDKTIEFINRHPDVEAYLIFSDEKGDFRTWISPGLERYISETEE
jgi:thiamine biosynthesis lipoprotein